MPNAARAHLCNHQGELGKHESDNPNPRFLTHGANTYGFKFRLFGDRRDFFAVCVGTQLAFKIGGLP